MNFVQAVRPRHLTSSAQNVRFIRRCWNRDVSEVGGFVSLNQSLQRIIFGKKFTDDPVVFVWINKVKPIMFATSNDV